jgi:hypothetical protein
MPITDDSRDQIFSKLKTILMKFSPPMVVSTDVPKTCFELIGNMPVPYGYDKKIIPGMSFGKISHLKESVTLHFFPAYLDTKLQDAAPSLHKCLKGKTCFHFSKVEQIDEQELINLFKKGEITWQKLGYMKFS